MPPDNACCTANVSHRMMENKVNITDNDRAKHTLNATLLIIKTRLPSNLRPTTCKYVVATQSFTLRELGFFTFYAPVTLTLTL